MSINWNELEKGEATISEEELQTALSWAENITDEDVDKLYAKFVEISTAENRRKAIIDNAMFLLQLGKMIALRV